MNNEADKVPLMASLGNIYIEFVNHDSHFELRSEYLIDFKINVTEFLKRIIINWVIYIILNFLYIWLLVY